MSKAPVYARWNAMKARCLNPKNRSYYRYGGRGISVDPIWMKFESFLADMGEPPAGLTMERIDNNGNYTKLNCKWATPKAQANNTRRNVRHETSKGPLTISEIADIAGVGYNTIQKRLELGLTGDNLLLPKYSKLPKSTTS